MWTSAGPSKAAALGLAPVEPLSLVLLSERQGEEWSVTGESGA